MFNKSNFCHIASNNRNEQKGSVFIYKTTDTLAQVTQSGYFNEKLIDINVHDLIIHVQYNPVDRTLKKSILIVTERTLDNVETAPILDQTIGDDIDQLGDQVAGIEEKIPGAASAANQLADKAFVNDIKTAIETTIAGINTSISTLNNDLSQTNQDVDSLQETKQDKATAVNYDNITNCITEIPQDIKLELNNGTLTLKAGSKVYVPNGAGVFDVVTIESDLSTTDTGSQTFVFYDVDNQSIRVRDITNSGTSDPQTPGTAYYDTQNNIINYYTLGGVKSQVSFPLCIATGKNIGGVDTTVSIDQVFNGFGYIGSTVFALPGVKGLIPNGRNADGSLNSIQFVVENPLYQNINITNLDVWSVLRIENGETVLKSTGTNTGGYNPNTNYNVFNGINSISCIITREHFDSNGKITSFAPKTNFHSVDYSDTEFIANQAMPSNKYIDLTLGASGATYQAPADGYFVLTKSCDNTNQILTIFNLSNQLESKNRSGTTTGGYSVFIPCQKGDTVQIDYTFGGNTNYFRFIYANGSK